MAETLRVDIWLWRARFFRSRALSAEHIRGHGLRLSHNGQTRRVDKPATVITPGDVVTLALGEHISTLEVLDLGTRRGPAAEAQALYRLIGGGA